ncbi:small secreted hydrophilic protein [Streptomyces chartreusis]|uniref:small secreted hydrophilic protein n=1 Tax=Streptomyces TaxID=1883 RepID=UPI002E80A0E3|nr:small secreted hydrophilic protein [Streptomyces chartreusis]WSZ70234.1 small secreted hydrophilic protein [Streptomyces chartreusis]WTA26782.1 small secreted hydrophilic protein [Streptomyces chartreusis]WUB17427.1 small secreted hydrophilic protein [Streptomyces chartreusis]
MAFSHRIAALAAVVAIPLGIAATSFALTDQPKSPEVPPRVELDSGSPTPTPTRPAPTPSDEVVSRPPVTDSPASDDDDDASDDDRGEPGDDG